MSDLEICIKSKRVVRASNPTLRPRTPKLARIGPSAPCQPLSQQVHKLLLGMDVHLPVDVLEMASNRVLGDEQLL